MWWLRLLEIIVTTAALCVCAQKYLHMLQLESYQLPGYYCYLSAHGEMTHGYLLFSGLGCEAAWLALRFLLTAFSRGRMPGILSRGIALVALAACVAAYEGKRRGTKEKKPFVFTARMKRLFGACAALSLAASTAMALAGAAPAILLCAVPALPIAAAKLMEPWERRVNMGFFRDAQATLGARPDLIKIGITGSFGKTSTKFILNTILSEKYCTLASPASFNTPMGLTRVIREQLEPRHQVFIAEMGARHKGDIAELVELVHPKYGLLTSVGAQHLETFGNMETVARTKFELIEGLGKEGVAFFVSDGGIVDSLYEKAKCEKTLVCSEQAQRGCYAKEIVCGPRGSSFVLVMDGNEVPVTTALLGRHNIQNICLACACARRLGLTDAQIARGVSKLKPVEHRLQLLPAVGGISVIDDAFNANPIGAREAVRVLSSFPGRHLVVTPGFVEEGGLEESMNREFGETIGRGCDIAILVGKKRAQPIAQGAMKTGMAREHIHIVASLEEAQRVLSQIGQAGDTVLFENDLPDNYTEK